MKCLDLLISVATVFLCSPLSAFQQAQPATQEPYALKVSTGLVSLSVAVAQRNGTAVPSLQKEDFQIYEDGVEQTISFFNQEREPVSWALMLDRSGSMKSMIRDVYLAAVHVIDGGTEHDEMFIATFNNKVELVCDLTPDRKRLQNSVLGLKADGRTALWDAIGFGLDHLKQAKHQKKVLVVVTDGEDNSSRLRFTTLAKRAQEEDVLIYTVGMFESVARGSSNLSELARVTGATAHFPRNLNECNKVMHAIASDVGMQYGIGYYPVNTMRDGKWRKIQVVIQCPGDKTKYVVRTRSGYFAPIAGTIK